MFTTIDTPPVDRKGVYRRANQKRAASSLEYKRQKRVTDYMTREFIAWDGEGYNHGTEHRYAILANSVGDTISAYKGLDTVDCFEMILNTECHKSAIHIIYGGSYDFNMMLKDLPREALEVLYAAGRVEWMDYIIEWRIGKSLRVGRAATPLVKAKPGRIIYDILPFFQCSFVKACDSYLGNDWYMRKEIIREKARRGDFSWQEIREGVAEYNSAELVNLVRLAEELRTRLDKVGIRINRWDGPGAIAVSLFQTYQIKDYMGETPPHIYEAARYAYAGGRFELVKQGNFGTVYEYDLNSAYPNAIQHLPCLSHGEWVQGTDVDQFGVYRIRFNGPFRNRDDALYEPKPLWHRNPDGTVVFMPVDGWYWTPEAELVRNDPRYEIVDGWTWKQHCDHVPFRWVGPMYSKRAALKKAEDGAHVGLKLGLNSLYGKLAQQVGARQDGKGKWHIPPYHNLCWAGYVTSSCRASVYQAAMLKPDKVIAFETDAVFMEAPLNLPISARLGEWEETVFDDLTYIKSGLYYGMAFDKNGELEYVEKTRGFNKGSVTRADMTRVMETGGVCEAPHTQFYTLGAALHTAGFDNWRKWETKIKGIQTWLVDSKRVTEGLVANGNRQLIIGETKGARSTAYSVAWLDDRRYDSDDDVLDFKRGGYDEWEA